MSRFIEYLERVSSEDMRVKAVLRRSLSCAPGESVEAFPYVEPFIKDNKGEWFRSAHYLIAGLWASHGNGGSESLGSAFAAHFVAQKKSPSVERRFVTLLGSDKDGLHYHLRQAVALLKDRSLDFDDVLRGILYWDSQGRRTQTAWARDFYRNV